MLRAQSQPQSQIAPSPLQAPSQASLLQRKCACGQHMIGGGQCDKCGKQPLRDQPGGEHAPSIIPPLVHEVLSAPGQPLDADAHAVTGRHFGRDFSHVRIHTDPKAASSARAINALAYTAGSDVVFDTGRYRPRTPQGQRLLVHEFGHVLQQQGAAYGMVQRATAATMAMDGRTSVTELIKELRSDAEFYRDMLGGTKPNVSETLFSNQLTEWKNSLTKAIELIKSELGNDAALTEELKSAYVDAVQSAVAVVKTPERTAHDWYDAYRYEIHEWAWPQEKAEKAANELSDALPVEERQRIKVSMAKIPDEMLQYATLLLSPEGQKKDEQLPEGVAIQFSSAIKKESQEGLTKVAAFFINSGIALNSTFTIPVDLGALGDYDAFRFTYIEHQPKAGTATKEVIVERLGSLGLKRLSPSQKAKNAEKFEAHKFVLQGTWNPKEANRLQAAIQKIPDNLLSPLDGMIFMRRGEKKRAATAEGKDAQGVQQPQKITAADYHFEDEGAKIIHKIVVYDAAFENADTSRYGLPGESVSDDLTQIIIHEIGHGLDQLPLSKAWGKRQETQAAFTEAKEKGAPDVAEKQEARREALVGSYAARSASGYFFAVNKETQMEKAVEGPIEPGNNEFRLAAQKDGGIRISNYSAESWAEFFAESFSLYILDPGTLKRLRKNVYEYFEKNFPKGKKDDAKAKP